MPTLTTIPSQRPRHYRTPSEGFGRIATARIPEFISNFPTIQEVEEEPQSESEMYLRRSHDLVARLRIAIEARRATLDI